MSRIRELTSKIPAVTAGLIAINCFIHIVIFLFSVSQNNFAISYAMVIRRGEYYRILSAAFVHGGILHIFMNMSSLLQLGMDMEVQFGSLQFLFLSLWSVVLVGIIYLGLSYVLSFPMGPKQLTSSAVGYSGVLFCYAVVEANHTTESSRSLFGIVSVPAKLMPFVLLVLLQVVLPGISMMGHLAGVIVGLLAVFGGLDVFMPSEACYEAMESSPQLAGLISRIPSYQRCTGRSLSIGSSSGAMGGCTTALAGVSFVLRQIWNVIATMLHVVGLGACADNTYARLSRCPTECSKFLSCLRPTSSSSVAENSINTNTTATVVDEVEVNAAGVPPITGVNSAFRTLRGEQHNGPGGTVYTSLNQNVTDV